ncbi:5' exonuclease apollo [Anaeramoeba flamelloides]|uniref:Protein artemis n=1 Tax=Anaeramoeba flamelloides TaxID=1746091 RepID=A0AAV8A8B3_9EUKA|nr:5' exonuclease apollo [Anaeramoeba flamelloides]
MQIGNIISVDSFKEKYNVQHYFLSNFLTRNLQGFNDGWRRGFIHCSAITKKLLLSQYELDSDLIIDHEFNQPELIYLDTSKQVSVTLTLIPNGHSPGSCMLLFNGSFGNVLYTSDFRLNDEILTNEILISYKERITRLFLDNTFCHPKYKLPSEEQAFRQIVHLLEKQTKPLKCVLAMRARIGRINLLKGLIKYFQTTINVTENRIRFLQAAEIKGSSFVTQDSKSIIHIIDQTDPSETTINNLQKIIGGFFVINLSGRYNNCQLTKYGENRYHVSHSLHSDYKELCNFIEFLSPKYVSPIRKDYPFELPEKIQERAINTQKIQFSSKNEKGGEFSTTNNFILPFDGIKKTKLRKMKKRNMGVKFVNISSSENSSYEEESFN